MLSIGEFIHINADCLRLMMIWVVTVNACNIAPCHTRDSLNNIL
jgi:hypothetical protein